MASGAFLGRVENLSRDFYLPFIILWLTLSALVVMLLATAGFPVIVYPWNIPVALVLGAVLYWICDSKDFLEFNLWPWFCMAIGVYIMVLSIIGWLSPESTPPLIKENFWAVIGVTSFLLIFFATIAPSFFGIAKK